MSRMNLDAIENQARAALAVTQAGEAAAVLSVVPELVSRLRALERVAEAAAGVVKTCSPGHEEELPGLRILRVALAGADACPMDWDDWFAKKGE